MGLRYLTILSAPSFRPTDISNLAGWYDATDLLFGSNPANNAAVSSWKDKSGNVKDISQVTGARQPTYKTSGVNSKGSVLFARGSNTYMTFASSFMSTGTAFDFFFVLRPTTISSASYFFYNDNNVSQAPVFSMSSAHIDVIANASWSNGQFNTTITANTTYLIEYQYNGSGGTTNGNFVMNLSNNVLTRTASNAGFGTSSATAIGSDIVDASLAYDGYMCELIFYSKQLNSTERGKVQTYLQAKWSY